MLPFSVIQCLLNIPVYPDIVGLGLASKEVRGVNNDVVSVLAALLHIFDMKHSIFHAFVLSFPLKGLETMMVGYSFALDDVWVLWLALPFRHFYHCGSA